MLQKFPSVKKRIQIIGSEWNSVSVRLPCYFVKGPFEQDFLDTYLTALFGVRKFKNTSAMMVIFFLERFKIDSKFRKCKKKEKIFLVFEIILSVKKKILVIASQWVDKQS